MPAAVATPLNCMTVGALMALAQGSIDTSAGLYRWGGGQAFGLQVLTETC